MNIERNLTRYNTEDLQCIAWALGPGGSVTVRYQSGREPKRWNRRSRRHSNVDHSAAVRSGGRSVFILPPKRLTEALEPSVALATIGRGVLPDFIVQEIAQAMLDTGSRWNGAPDLTHLRVRIEKRVQESIASRKRSQAEKIEFMQDMYGHGGIQMSGSRRTGQYLWQNRVSEAAHYYTREWERRDAWRQKLQTAGVEVEPHETWAEYLRRQADEWEAEQKRMAEWRAARLGRTG